MEVVETGREDHTGTMLVEDVDAMLVAGDTVEKEEDVTGCDCW